MRKGDIGNVSSLINDVGRPGVRAETLLALGSEQVHTTMLNLLGRALLTGTHNVDHLVVVDFTCEGLVVILREVIIAELRDL